MNARWLVNYLGCNHDNEILQRVEVYAEHGNKEVLKCKNKGMQLTRKRELIILDRAQVS